MNKLLLNMLQNEAIIKSKVMMSVIATLFTGALFTIVGVMMHPQYIIFILAILCLLTALCLLCVGALNFCFYFINKLFYGRSL